VIIVMLTVLVSCGRTDHIGIRPDTDASPITVAASMRTENLGRVIRVRGTVGEICQDEGCWFTLTDGTAEIRMRFADPSLGIPVDLKGDVFAEGVVHERIERGTRVPEMSVTGVVLLTRP
jgi:hypothetical protein